MFGVTFWYLWLLICVSCLLLPINRCKDRLVITACTLAGSSLCHGLLPNDMLLPPLQLFGFLSESDILGSKCLVCYVLTYMAVWLVVVGGIAIFLAHLWPWPTLTSSGVLLILVDIRASGLTACGAGTTISLVPPRLFPKKLPAASDEETSQHLIEVFNVRNSIIDLLSLGN